MSLQRLILGTLILLAYSSLSVADGVFMVVKGDVKLQTAGKGILPAKVGMKVSTGDKIIAGTEARAKVVMQDKNVLNISPNTQIVIEKYVYNENTNEKNVTLNVLYGKVRSTVNQKYDGEKNKFEIKTPSAVAGVRGTDFLTQFNTSTHQAKFVTFEGAVAVGQLDSAGKMMNPVIVNPGQFSVASVGTPPTPPAVMPKTEFASLNQTSKTDNKNDRDPAMAPPKAPENAPKDGKEPDANKPGASKSDGKPDGRAPASVGAGGPDQGLKPPSMLGDVGKELPNDMPPAYMPTEPPPQIADMYHPPQVPQDILQQRTLLIINVNLGP